MLSVKPLPRWAKICGLLCLGSLSSPLLAATVTLVGDNFNLSYDDSQPDLAIYGAPVYGTGTNNIFFNQVDFKVTSTDGDGNLESQASTVAFTLTRNSPSFNFQSLQLFEFGNYTLNGPGASVNLTGSMAVYTPNAFGPQVAGPPGIAPITDMTINDNAAHNWNGSAFADLTVPGESPFGPNGWEDEAAIIISINNILQANTTQGGTSAFIQKLQSGQAVQLGVNGSPANPVPVPAAVWLMGSGLLGLLGVVRRRAV